MKTLVEQETILLHPCLRLPIASEEYTSANRLQSPAAPTSPSGTTASTLSLPGIPQSNP